MDQCPLLRKCEFFHDVIEDMPASSDFLKNTHCLGIYKNCARYIYYFATAKHSPPQDLFPDGHDLLDGLIRRYREYGY
jgi:hypothetical protein